MASTRLALRAAVAAARANGLPADDPRIVRDSTNVLVELRPAPIVARVPLTFTRLRGHDWAVQHVRLAASLAAAGAPVAPPAGSVDPGPHVQDGLAVTFWALVDHDPSRADAAVAGRSLRELHDALAAWSKPLPTCDRLDELGRLLDLLGSSRVVSAGELDRLREVRATLRPLRGRPLHGDAHLANVLWSPDGPLWTDLENACEGPVEWDLACLAWREAPGTEAALAAYGSYDEARLAAVTPALSLFLAGWTAVAAERVGTEAAIGEARRRIARAIRDGGSR